MKILVLKVLPFIGAEKLVRHLHQHQIPIAIASGGAQEGFELKTTNHKEFAKLFKHIVLASTDPEVKNGKPAPDVFLICAERFPDPPKPEQVFFVYNFFITCSLAFVFSLMIFFSL